MRLLQNLLFFSELVPAHGFVKETKAAESIIDPSGDIEIIDESAGTKYFYGACPFTTDEKNKDFKCGACKTVEPWENSYARERLFIHMIICHPGKKSFTTKISKLFIHRICFTKDLFFQI